MRTEAALGWGQGVREPRGRGQEAASLRASGRFHQAAPRCQVPDAHSQRKLPAVGSSPRGACGVGHVPPGGVRGSPQGSAWLGPEAEAHGGSGRHRHVSEPAQTARPVSSEGRRLRPPRGAPTGPHTPTTLSASRLASKEAGGLEAAPTCTRHAGAHFEKCNPEHTLLWRHRRASARRPRPSPSGPAAGKALLSVSPLAPAPSPGGLAAKQPSGQRALRGRSQLPARRANTFAGGEKGANLKKKKKVKGLSR